MNKTINFYKLFHYYIEGLKPSSKKALVRCIFHSDSRPSLSINTENGLYNCFSCGAKGNHWTFLKFVEPESNIRNLMEKYYE